MTTALPDIPEIVSVIGGGRMGAGIAQVFAAAGATVTIAEADPEAAGAALERVNIGLQRAAQKGVLADDPGRVLSRVEVVSSITDLAAALENPRRVVGMHFFNPVPASLLVEIVRAPETADDVVNAALGWVHALGKSDVVVRDSPGFATSRLGVALGLEAIRMLEEGVADTESIDRAMELGYRHPMGPLRSTDLVGLDVRLAIAEHLHATLGARFEPPQLLRDKVANGDRGRKTGQGFYPWPR
jgi:3-hydroxybutyryl-CoA dehydrogenase